MTHKYYSGFCLPIHPHNDEILKKYGDNDDTPQALHRARAAFLNGVEWPQNYIIKICFIQDKNFSQDKADWVQQVVTKYILPIVNLKFTWGEPQNSSDVRITFDSTQGAYSVLGTEAQSTPKDQNTMNLGWLDKDSTNSDFPEAIGTGAVVVHEFGHMLGLIHEHSRASDDVPFKWCDSCVYQYLEGPPNSWTADQVKQQVLTPYTQDQYNGSKYDKNSIMHYYFPSNFFSPPYNLPHTTKLSDLDIVWINKKYPGKPLPKNIKPNLDTDDNNSDTSTDNISVWVYIGIVLLIVIILLFVFKKLTPIII
jgi:hypothetical protein